MTDQARGQTVTIRRFMPEDADAVAAVIRETLLTSNIADYPRDELEGLADWYSAPGLISRVPFCRRLVAMASATAGPSVVPGGSPTLIGTAARRENKLEGFFVAPGWQGLGIGSALLAALLDDARSDALRAVWLESSLTAVGFYESHGFQATSGPVDCGDGLVVPMRVRLESA